MAGYRPHLSDPPIIEGVDHRSESVMFHVEHSNLVPNPM
jgi:hypothetical protein